KLEALLRLGEHDEALRLAYSTLFPADRLVMLTRICRFLNEEGYPISEDLKKNIEQLIDQVALSLNPELRSKLLDAAENIFPIYPNLSVDILERISTDKNPDVQLMDILL